MDFFDFRFYARKDVNCYKLLGDTSIVGREYVFENETGKISSPFCEVKFTVLSNRTMMVVRVDEIFVESMNPEAVKATIDYNAGQAKRLLEASEEKNKNIKNPQEWRMLLQEIKDRSEMYGPSFDKALEELLDKHPIEVGSVEYFSDFENNNARNNTFRVVKKAS